MVAPNVVIHDLASGQMALHGVARFGLRSIIFHSPPSAADYLGPAVFLEISKALKKHLPSVTVTTVFDCGEAMGRAMDAIRHGVDGISISAPPNVYARIESLARQSHVLLYQRPGQVNLFDFSRHDINEVSKKFELWLGRHFSEST